MSRTYFFTICVIIFQHTGRIVSYYAFYTCICMHVVYKRWKVQFRKGLRKFNNVDSKTTYFNENCCIM